MNRFYVQEANHTIDTTRAVLEYSPRYDRFEWFGPRSQSHLPKLAGFYWSPADRCWITQSSAKARKLKQFADSGALARLDSTLQIA